jgi:hypothetical protein
MRLASVRKFISQKLLRGLGTSLIISWKVCMVKIILFLSLLFTPRNFIIAKLSICEPGYSSMPDIISTDEDRGLHIDSFATIRLPGVNYKL